jgi:hypothetical protein
MKVLAYCWRCNKEHDITRWKYKYGVRCDDCDGYVISPSGKVQSRIDGDITEPYEPMLKVIE